MKKFLVTISLLLILILPLSFAEESYSNLTNELNNMEFIEETRISEEAGHLYLQMNVTFQDGKMIYYYQDIIEKVYLASPAKSITLLIYSDGFPQLRIQSTQVDIENYINEIIDRNEFIEKMGIEDIRSIEQVLYDELNLFDAYITGIFVDESESRIQLESMKGPDSFQDDYMAMVLTVIENTPWVDTIVFEFFKNDEQVMTIKGNKVTFLEFMKGAMSEKDFVESLIVNVSNTIDKEKTSSNNDYIIINTNSGSINEIIGDSKTFKLNVPETNEYYFKINNFDTVKAELIIMDSNMQLVDNNLRDEEVVDYIYVDLEKGNEYYLEVKPLINTNEPINIKMETSSSIIPFLFGILIVFGGLIFVIMKLIKKVKSQ